MKEFFEYIIKYLSYIKPADVIDIAIVSYVVYKIIFFIKETRAIQLLKGILLLLVVLQVSEWAKLNAINFILRNTLQWGLIAVIVIFQPEIRRILERMGRSRIGLPFFGYDEKDAEKEKKDAISAVTAAAAQFSESKTGALIVFERETRLGDVIRTGTLLEAKVSTELLGNIFFKNSPLHDGAVVIREDRVFAAACVLPLSQQDSISKELGTRHRAALGMSELSDAVTVVVSEENGKISIAADGVLTRNLNPETLERALTKALVLSAENKDKLSVSFRLWKGKTK